MERIKLPVIKQYTSDGSGYITMPITYTNSENQQVTPTSTTVVATAEQLMQLLHLTPSYNSSSSGSTGGVQTVTIGGTNIKQYIRKVSSTMESNLSSHGNLMQVPNLQSNPAGTPSAEEGQIDRMVLSSDPETIIDNVDCDFDPDTHILTCIIYNRSMSSVVQMFKKPNALTRITYEEGMDLYNEYTNFFEFNNFTSIKSIMRNGNDIVIKLYGPNATQQPTELRQYFNAVSS